MTNKIEKLKKKEVVRGIVPDDNDKVLLVRRSPKCTGNPGEWEFPGGQREEGETDDEALNREMREEVGREVESVTGVVHEEARIMEGGNHDGHRYLARFIMARLVTGEVHLSPEHDTYTWASVERALDYNLTPQSRRALIAFGPILNQTEALDANGV